MMFKIYNNFIIPGKLKKSILLIGNFDGLHLGHQKVCTEAIKFKKKYKLKLGVLTFNPLPGMFFNKKLKNYRLTSDFQKFILLKKIGIDFIINKRFNLKFSKITSKQFIKNIIVKKIDPIFIFVSNNFRYGNKRKGDVKELINGAIFNEKYDQMVAVKDIEFYSMCEHHLLPFFGHAHIAYIPNGKIIGLSKIPRILDMFSRRLQVQERMTQEVANMLNDALEPKGVAVIIEAQHMCMQMRGVEKRQSYMSTSAMLGIFRDDDKTRKEFLDIVKLRKKF